MYSYFRHPKTIISKKKFFEEIEKYDKIEYIKSTCNLDDVHSIKVYPYIKIHNNTFLSFLGVLKSKHNIIPLGIFTGIQNCKKDHFITHNQIKKLLKIEQEYDIDLEIPKIFKDLLNERT